MDAATDPSITCIKLAPGTYALSESIEITARALAIVAEEGRATLDGGGLVRHMYISSGATVSLSGLALINGKSSSSAGAILNYGTLLTEDCILRNNTASGADETDSYSGALYSGTDSALEMRNCTLEDNALIHSGTAQVVRRSLPAPNARAPVRGVAPRG